MRRIQRAIADLGMASELSRRMRSALDFSFAVGLLMVLTVIGVSNFENYLIRGQIAEAFALSSTVKGDMITHRAERGDWPASESEFANATLSEQSNLGAYVDRFELGPNGSLTANFSEVDAARRLQRGRLTFRPVSHPSDPGAPVAFVCGSHRYPDGLLAGGEDKTDIASSDLPSACRNY